MTKTQPENPAFIDYLLTFEEKKLSIRACELRDGLAAYDKQGIRIVHTPCLPISISPVKIQHTGLFCIRHKHKPTR